MVIDLRVARAVAGQELSFGIDCRRELAEVLVESLCGGDAYAGSGYDIGNRSGVGAVGKSVGKESLRVRRVDEIEVENLSLRAECGIGFVTALARGESEEISAERGELDSIVLAVKGTPADVGEGALRSGMRDARRG